MRHERVALCARQKQSNSCEIQQLKGRECVSALHVPETQLKIAAFGLAPKGVS
jgi:hypothetical protein